MKKTLAGIGLAPAVLVPSGLAVAQPPDYDPDAVTVQDQDRLHTGECEFAEDAAWGDRYQEGEQMRHQYRNNQDNQNQDHLRKQVHEPGEFRLDGDAVRQGPMNDGSGPAAGFAAQRAPNFG